jgi:hypothetical protein
MPGVLIALPCSKTCRSNSRYWVIAVEKRKHEMRKTHERKNGARPSRSQRIRWPDNAWNFSQSPRRRSAAGGTPALRALLVAQVSVPTARDSAGFPTVDAAGLSS